MLKILQELKNVVLTKTDGDFTSRQFMFRLDSMTVIAGFP